MGKVLKWVGIVLGGLVGVVVVAALVLFLVANGRVNKTYDIAVASVVAPPGDASLERGRHFVESIGSCTECHGADLSEDVITDDTMFGTVVASNLTSGQGAASADRTATSTMCGPSATA